MIKERVDKVKYIIKHRKEFRCVEKEFIGKNTIREYLHDLFKIPTTILLGPGLASKIHRRISRHHSRAKTKEDYIQMVIDWECARFSKLDKPLNARETMKVYYPELKTKVKPIIDKMEKTLYGGIR